MSQTRPHGLAVRTSPSHGDSRDVTPPTSARRRPHPRLDRLAADVAAAIRRCRRARAAIERLLADPALAELRP